MKSEIKNISESHWCFAIINGRLGEIHFTNNKKGKSEIWGHCYVKREKFSKKEQKMIDSDIEKHRFTWRNKIYKYKSKK